MKIAIGADHAGYRLKNELIEFLSARGEQVKDLGTNSEEQCDYPDIAARVAGEVSSGKVSRGVLVCTTGIGMAMVANKFPRVRAAACYSPEQAKSSREHNNANVLALGSKYVTTEVAKAMLEIWLKTDFKGPDVPRYARRDKKITEIEKGLK